MARPNRQVFRRLCYEVAASRPCCLLGRGIRASATRCPLHRRTGWVRIQAVPRHLVCTLVTSADHRTGARHVCLCAGDSCEVETTPGKSPDRAPVCSLCTAVAWGYSAGMVFATTRALRISKERPSLPFWTKSAVRQSAGRWILATCVTFMVLYMLVDSTAALARQYPQAAAFAADWDAQDEQIQAFAASGRDELVLDHVPVYPGADSGGTLSDDPEYWVNACIADYYGLESISAQ